MGRANEERLQEELGYQFVRPALLERALTHSSAIPELRAAAGAAGNQEVQIEDNERFEFLGDAVLDLLASEYLLWRFPDWTEGQLSRSRARIVNAHALQVAARRVGIGECLRLGKGEEKTGGREKQAILADALEAVVAAVYLDGGLLAAREVLRTVLFEQAMEDTGEQLWESDRKSALQEYLQRRGQPPAEYRLAGASGPDHQKTFVVEVWSQGECLSSGEGTTKKEAEQKAARDALEKLAQLEPKS